MNETPTRLKLLTLLVLASTLVGAPVGHASATCSDSKSCLAAIESAQKETRSLSAKFEQTKHVSLMNEPIITRGSFAYQAPDVVIWRTEDPPVRIRISKAGVDLPPEVEREAGSGLKALTGALQQVGGLLTGSLEGIEQLFEVTAKPSPAGISVHLVPRHASVRDLFSAIDMEFESPHLWLRSIRISESLGDRLEIVFSEYHRNDAQAEAAVR